MLTKVKECKAINSNLENIPGSVEEDKQQIAEVDAIRLKALKVIHDVLCIPTFVIYILCGTNDNHIFC